MAQPQIPGLSPRGAPGAEVRPQGFRVAGAGENQAVAPLDAQDSLSRVLRALVDLTDERRRAAEVRREGAIERVAASESTASALKALERALPSGAVSAAQGAVLDEVLRRHGLGSPLDAELARRKVGEYAAARAGGQLEARLQAGEFQGLDGPARFDAAMAEAFASAPAALSASPSASGAFQGSMRAQEIKLRTKYAAARAQEDRQVAVDAIEGELVMGSADGTLRGLQHLGQASPESAPEVAREIAQQLSAAQRELNLSAPQVVETAYRTLRQAVNQVKDRDPASARRMADYFDEVVLETGFPLDGSKGLPASALALRADIESTILAAEQKREEDERRYGPEDLRRLTSSVEGAVYAAVVGARERGEILTQEEVREVVDGTIAQNSGLLTYLTAGEIEGLRAESIAALPGTITKRVEEARKSNGAGIMAAIDRSVAIGDLEAARMLAEEAPPELRAEALQRADRGALAARARSEDAVNSPSREIADLAGRVAPELVEQAAALSAEFERALSSAVARNYGGEDERAEYGMRVDAALKVVDKFRAEANRIKAESALADADVRTRVQEISQLALTDPSAARVRLSELQGRAEPEQLRQLSSQVEGMEQTRIQVVDRTSSLAQQLYSDFVETSASGAALGEGLGRAVTAGRAAIDAAVREFYATKGAGDLTVIQSSGLISQEAMRFAEERAKEDFPDEPFAVTQSAVRRREEERLAVAARAFDPGAVAEISTTRLRELAGLRAGEEFSGPLAEVVDSYVQALEGDAEVSEGSIKAWMLGPEAERAAAMSLMLSSGLFSPEEIAAGEATFVLGFATNADETRARLEAAGAVSPEDLAQIGRFGRGTFGTTVRVTIKIPDDARLLPAAAIDGRPEELLAPRGALARYRRLLGLPDSASREDVARELQATISRGRYLTQ